MKVAISPVGNY